jgi:hypothetical protein
MSPTEKVIASLHVNGSADEGRIAAAVVRAASREAGLTAEQASHLADAAAAVVRAIDLRGFDDPRDAAVDLSMVVAAHRVIVRIDDLGLPFNYAAEDEVDGSVISAALEKGWIEQFRHESLGRSGNRTVLSRHLEIGHDLRDSASIEDHHQAHSAPAAGDHIQIETRIATADDADGICQLAWRTYGYTYQHDEYYLPGRLAAMIASGHQISFVSLTTDGMVVGHTGLLLESPEDILVEAGRGMVDPRYRGHHLMSATGQVQAEWLGSSGILAIEAAAVTAHTKTQSENMVANIQLAFLPPIEFRDMPGTGVPDRQTVVGSVYPVADIPAQEIYAPRRDAEMLDSIYQATRFSRTLLESRDGPVEAETRVDVSVHADLGHAILHIRKIGRDLEKVLEERVRAIRAGGVQVIYCDLPLDSPAVDWASEILADASFVFAGPLPLKNRGIDMLRYQSLGSISVDRAQINVKSALAERLLDYVFDQLPESQR